MALADIQARPIFGLKTLVANLVTRWTLFLSSYAPLFGITVIRYWDTSTTVVVGASVFGVLGIGGLVFYFQQASTISPQFITVRTIQPHGSEAMAYIVTYIIPFLELDLSSFAEQLSFLLLFFVVGIVYVNSDLIYVNPILGLQGYKTFEVVPDDGIARLLLTKTQFVRPEDRLRVARIGDYLFLEKKERLKR